MDIRLQQGSKGWFALVDYIVLFFAIIANCFALHSVLKSQFGLKAYRRFLISLVVSDLFVCGIHLLTFINQSLADHFNGGDSLQPCVTNFLRGLLIFGVFANLYNLCGMSIDHYIGIIYPMRYSYITNNGLARSSVIIVWILALCCGFADVPVVTIMYFLTTNGHTEDTSTFSLSRRSLVNCTPSSLLLPGMNFLLSTTTLNPLIKKKTSSLQLGTNRPNSTKWLRTALPDDLDSVDLIELRQIIQDSIGTFQHDPASYSSTACKDEGQSARESQFLREYSDFQKTSEYDHEATNNWCLFSNSSKIWLELFVIFCILICLLFLVICYGKLFRTVAVRIREHGIRKLVITTCLLIGNFTICWFPFMFFEITMWAIVSHEPTYQNGPQPESLLIAHNVINTLFLSHPLVDPIVYVVRLPKVQQFMIRKYSWLWCKSHVNSNGDIARAKSLNINSRTNSGNKLVRATRVDSTISELNDDSDLYNETTNCGITLKHVKQLHYTTSTSAAASSASAMCARKKHIIACSIALERVSSNVIEHLREESAYNREQSLAIFNNNPCHNTNNSKNDETLPC